VKGDGALLRGAFFIARVYSSDSEDAISRHSVKVNQLHCCCSVIRTLLFKSVCLAAPSSLLTDIVWPALLLEGRLLSTIPILTGLVVEWLALRFGGFGLSWKRAAIVDVAMNAVSTAVGVVLIPALGIAWELFPGSVLYKLFKSERSILVLG
jgi:hypothetical protein